MNNNDYDKLIRSASEKLGSSPEDLRKSLEKKDLSALSAILTKSDKQKLRRVLADQGTDEAAEIRRVAGGSNAAAQRSKMILLESGGAVHGQYRGYSPCAGGGR